MQLIKVDSVDTLPGRPVKKKEDVKPDPHGEELVMYPCLICGTWDMARNLQAIHLPTGRHDVVHAECAASTGVVALPCEC